MKKLVLPTSLLLFALAAQIALAQSYPGTCPPEAQAIINSVGGCSAVDSSTYRNIHQKCCSSPGGGTVTTLAPVVNISATPGIIDYNQTSTLSWAATNASSCTASGDWSGNKATSFQESVGPLTASKTYKIVCTGAGGASSEAQTTVTVRAVQTDAGSGGQTSSTCDSTAQAIINSVGGCSKIDANAYPNIKQKCCGSTTLTTTSSTGLTTSGGGGRSSGGGGGFAVGQATGGSGTGGTLAGALSPTMVFVVDNSQIQKGQSVNFSWSSTNAESCYASGGWSGSKGTSGTEKIGPLNANRDFGLTCKSGSAEARRNITITVLGEKPITPQPLPQISPGRTDKVPVQRPPTRVSEEPVKKIVQPAKTPSAQVPTVSPPIISFSADSTLAEGESTTLVWAASGADSCVALGSWSGEKALSGSESTDVIKDDSIFVLICKGKGGEASKTMKISVTGKGKGLIATIFDGIVGLFAGKKAPPPPSAATGQVPAPSSAGAAGVAEGEGTQARGTPEIQDERSVINKFAGPPQVNLSVTPVIRAGRTATIEWEAKNASECVAGGAWNGGKQESGREISAELSADTTYTLVCVGRNGETASASATVIVYAETFVGNSVNAVKNILDDIFSK